MIVSLQSLHNDVCWESLQVRRTKHKLNVFIKMQKHHLTDFPVKWLRVRLIGNDSSTHIGPVPVWVAGQPSLLSYRDKLKL